MKLRLKAHKSGARYLLRPTDVVIASYFPIGVNVHIVRAIISHEQDAERGEWNTSKPFVHTTRSVSSDRIANLEPLFERLAELRPWARAGGYSPDYEEAVRRLLRFRVDRAEIVAFLPRRGLWSELGVTQEGVVAFGATWSAVWDCIGTMNDIELSTPTRYQD